MKQDGSTLLTLPQAIWSGKEHWVVRRCRSLDSLLSDCHTIKGWYDKILTLYVHTNLSTNHNTAQVDSDSLPLYNKESATKYITLVIQTRIILIAELGKYEFESHELCFQTMKKLFDKKLTCVKTNF